MPVYWTDRWNVGQFILAPHPFQKNGKAFLALSEPDMVVLEAGVVVTVINVVLKSENVLDKLLLGLIVVLVLLPQCFQLRVVLMDNLI